MHPTITGRWGKPSEVLLDLIVDADGTVHGVANPGRQDAQISRGHFDATTGVVMLEGEHLEPDGATLPFHIEGRLDGRTLRLSYHFGEMDSVIDIVRVEEYKLRPVTLADRLKTQLEDLKRGSMHARVQAVRTCAEAARTGRVARLDHLQGRRRGRHPRLAELHVTT